MYRAASRECRKESRARGGGCLIHRIINLTDALDALAHDAVTHAHHHDRETDVRNETMRERTREKRSLPRFSRMAMGQECERQHDTCRDAQLDEHQAQGRALAILVGSKWSTLLCFTTPMVMLMSTSHTSHTEVRWSTKWPVNQRMPRAGKRMGERLGHRSCKQPRNQNHHYFGYSQR